MNQLSKKEREFIEAVRDFKKYNDPEDFDKHMLNMMLHELLQEEV